MICTESFCSMLERVGVNFFTGVPDSLLKAFCAYVSDHVPPERHVTAANEGGAVALAAGHYLASGRPALVYMQNSGQGNAVNPLLSLADPDVYGIPMLLLVGWRGEPGVKDEPQHLKQGQVTQALFEAMDIPCRILPDNNSDAASCLEEMIRRATTEHRPVALLVRAGTFEPYARKAPDARYSLKREAALEMVVSCLPECAALVSTTGQLSRELYECRERNGQGHERDFLTVGSMGHASQIAQGIALHQTTRPVICLDGDGALLMHLGAPAIIGSLKAPNYHHVLLNNGVHDSVGAQKTVGFDVDFVQLALACGYVDAVCVDGEEALLSAFRLQLQKKGPSFLEVRVAPGARKDLGRPKTTPDQNKRAFMDFLQST
ncbi:MAG: phosphonopyruvate decarboxylase [Kiritimatiellae bacterium]|nr:phosphonopyruvate decarboxylase [Kiritimatiellia bacterium]MDD4734698.1 phosphonopyruvate decarboxylase [Kiritimatiellia bacterium]